MMSDEYQEFVAEARQYKGNVIEMSEQVKVGDVAPDFTAPVVGGKYEDDAQISLSDLRGEKVVLYFYPKDDTPGCTKQACALRDSWKVISKKARVFGVSIDPVKRHRKFIDKYSLPFPLISDESQEIVEAYAVWVQKKLYGREYMGTERTSFVIDEKGKIAAVFPKVKPDEHLPKLLEVLK